MGKTYVLDRVAADLARGLTHPAIQRLSSLVHAYPTDLDLRRRLAALHRRVGNHVQAGRWDYLTIGADTSAFERAFPSAAARLRAVRWPYRANAAGTSYARSRLAKLTAAAQAESAAGAGATISDGQRESSALASAAPAGDGGDRQLGSPPGHGARAHRLLGWLTSVLSWRRWRRTWRSPSTSLLAVALVVTASLSMVGLVTVVEWFVQ